MNMKRLPALIVGLLALFIVSTLTGLVLATGFNFNPWAFGFGTICFFVAAGYAGWREGKKRNATKAPTD